MNRSLCLISAIFISVSSILNAQEQRVSQERVIPELRRRSLVLDIDARVLETGLSTGSRSGTEVQVVWSETHQKITIPGTPVGIRLEGSNVIVAVQFTPFIRRHGNVLAAQVQLGINDPEHGFSYHTSIQTIPFEFNEPIYFFPLGKSDGTSSIEIILTVNPFREAASNESSSNEAANNTNNDN
jgi:hypothetical protein